MIFIILFVILFMSYFVAENKFILRTRHENLGGDIKIAHVADLHKRKFGKGNKRLISRISAENPDIILISGDLVSRDCTDFSAVKKLLDGLCTIAPVYMVFGNHETDLSPEYKNQLIRTISRTNAVLLKNETVPLKLHRRRLNISGLELSSDFYKKDGSYRRLDVLDIHGIKKLMGDKPDGETLLLTHNPLFARVYAQWGADYAVCGHVHGGAVGIPFTGRGLLSPERKLLPEYTKGIYTVGIMKLLLSGGLGKLRMFNPPEIVIYTI